MSSTAPIWYIGFCLKTTEADRQYIDPLARMRRDSREHPPTIAPLAPDDFKLDECVLWEAEPDEEFDFRGLVVEFRRTPERDSDGNYLVHGSEDEWYLVQSCWRVVGGTDWGWRDGKRYVKHSVVEEILYLHEPDDTIVGPWEVVVSLDAGSPVNGLIPAEPNGQVFKRRINAIQRNTFGSFFVPFGLPSQIEFLTIQPCGVPYDSATPAQIVDWFFQELASRKQYHEAMKKIDIDFPGWRTELKRDLNDCDYFRKVVFRHRIDVMKRQIDWANDIYEELNEVGEILRQLTEQRISQLVGKSGEKILRTAHQQACEKIVTSGIHQIEDGSRAVQIASSMGPDSKGLGESGICVKPVGPKVDPGETRTEGRNALLPTAITLTSDRAVPIAALKQASNAEPSPREFVRQRLWPALANWMPQLGLEEVEDFYAAMVGSRAVLIPCPAWGRAFFDALGGSTSFTSIFVEPTWSRFGDLWTGEFGECWNRAIAEPNRLEIVLLRDFNRALPQCYARPLFDLLAGFVDRLPKPAGDGRWPLNLRVLACPAPISEAMPISHEMVRHFAAVSVKRRSEVMTLATSNSLRMSNEEWLRWATKAKAARDSAATGIAYTNCNDPLERLANQDAHAIAYVLRTLGACPVPTDVQSIRRVRNIRIVRPGEYVNFPEDLRIGAG